MEAAHGGTLFLDEVGDIPLTMQVKLCACSRAAPPARQQHRAAPRRRARGLGHAPRPAALIAAGRFREDLYHRLATFPDRCRRCASGAATSAAGRLAARARGASARCCWRRRRWTRAGAASFPGNARTAATCSSAPRCWLTAAPHRGRDRAGAGAGCRRSLRPPAAAQAPRRCATPSSDALRAALVAHRGDWRSLAVVCWASACASLYPRKLRQLDGAAGLNSRDPHFRRSVSTTDNGCAGMVGA